MPKLVLLSSRIDGTSILFCWEWVAGAFDLLLSSRGVLVHSLTFTQLYSIFINFLLSYSFTLFFYFILLFSYTISLTQLYFVFIILCFVTLLLCFIDLLYSILLLSYSILSLLSSFLSIQQVYIKSLHTLSVQIWLKLIQIVIICSIYSKILTKIIVSVSQPRLSKC